jgi:tellurite resistance protein
MTNLVVPIEAVSSQRSGEIEPKAGIAIANRKGQFAPKEGEVVLKLILALGYLPITKVTI